MIGPSKAFYEESSDDEEKIEKGEEKEQVR